MNINVTGISSSPRRPTVTMVEPSLTINVPVSSPLLPSSNSVAENATKGFSSRRASSSRFGSPLSSLSKVEKEAQQQATEAQQRERQQRIVASTFANMELFMAKETLQSANTLHEQASAEVERLKLEMEARDRDALEVVDFLRSDATAKAAKVKDLEIELTSHLRKKSEDEQAIKRRYEAVIREKDATLKAAEDQIDRLSRELESVAQYQVERSELMLALENARAKQKNTIEHYEQELNRVKFAAVEDRVRIQALEADMDRKFKSEVEERSTAIAKLKNVHIHETNTLLTKDREILQQEVDALVKLSNDYKGEIAELKRLEKVSADVHAHAMKASVALKMKVQDADNQRRYAEAERTEALQAFQKERSEREAFLLSKIELLEKRLDDSDQTRKAQVIELNKLRKLSTTIVNGRSGLEQFFHAAIAEVRARHHQQLIQGVAGGGEDVQTLPRIMPPPSPRSTLPKSTVQDPLPREETVDDKTFLTSTSAAIYHNGHGAKSSLAAATANTVVTTPRRVGSGATLVSAAPIPAHLQRLLTNEPNPARLQLLTGGRSARNAVISSGSGVSPRVGAQSAQQVGGFPLLPTSPLYVSNPPEGGAMRTHAREGRVGGGGGNGDGASAERTIDPKAYYHNHVADARMLASASRREMLNSYCSGSGSSALVEGFEMRPSTSPAATASGHATNVNSASGVLLPTHEAYEGMAWDEKELVLKGMLRYLQFTMMAATTSNTTTPQSGDAAECKDAKEAPAIDVRGILNEVGSASNDHPAFYGNQHQHRGDTVNTDRPSTSAVAVHRVGPAKDPTKSNGEKKPADVDWVGEKNKQPHGAKNTSVKTAAPLPPSSAGIKGTATIQQHAFAPRPPANLARPPTSDDGEGPSVASLPTVSSRPSSRPLTVPAATSRRKVMAQQDPSTE